jgi:hypothetical protein
MVMPPFMGSMYLLKLYFNRFGTPAKLPGLGGSISVLGQVL